MRVSLLQEGHRPDPSIPIAKRYREMLDEAILADQVGFDVYGQGEQHFARNLATVPSPEIAHAYLAGRTTRIRFRAMAHNLLPYNNPYRLAEQLAALDILSNGRAEFGAARSNNLYTMEGFGVAATDTKKFRDEALSLIAKAISQDTFEHHGDVYDMPERALQPKCVQDPHPPMWLSATSADSHHDAGRLGLGVMCGNTSAGWEYAQECVDVYRKASKEAEPIGAYVHDEFAMLSTCVNIGHDAQLAKEQVRPVATKWMETIMRVYTDLAKHSPDYAYLDNISKLKDRMYDLDYLVDCAPYITIGTPEFFIERANVLASMGVDEWLLRLDGMGHELNMAAIEMIGKEVIPAVHELEPVRADRA